MLEGYTELYQVWSMEGEMKLKICSSIVEPKNVEVPSQSKVGTYYNVITPTIYQEGMCDCPDFQYRERECKHLRMVQEYRCPWYEEYTPQNEKQLDRMEECPLCKGSVTTFETEPEYE